MSSTFQAFTLPPGPGLTAGTQAAVPQLDLDTGQNLHWPLLRSISDPLYASAAHSSLLDAAKLIAIFTFTHSQNKSSVSAANQNWLQTHPKPSV